MKYDLYTLVEDIGETVRGMVEVELREVREKHTDMQEQHIGFTLTEPYPTFQEITTAYLMPTSYFLARAINWLTPEGTRSERRQTVPGVVEIFADLPPKPVEGARYCVAGCKGLRIRGSHFDDGKSMTLHFSFFARKLP